MIWLDLGIASLGLSLIDKESQWFVWYYTRGTQTWPGLYSIQSVTFLSLGGNFQGISQQCLWTPIWWREVSNSTAELLNTCLGFINCSLQVRLLLFLSGSKTEEIGLVFVCHANQFKLEEQNYYHTWVSLNFRWSSDSQVNLLSHILASCSLTLANCLANAAFDSVSIAIVASNKKLATSSKGRSERSYMSILDFALNIDPILCLSCILQLREPFS